MHDTQSPPLRLVLFPEVGAERLQRLKDAAPELEIVNAPTFPAALAATASADGFFGKITPELLAAAARLRWVQAPTASLEHYMFPELAAHPCLLSNMRGLYSDVVADHVMGFILCFARNLHRYVRAQQRKRWEPVGGEATRSGWEAGPGETSGVDRAHVHLPDCTLGVVGVGSIGGEVARRGAAFGMRVLGVDPFPRPVAGVLEDIWPLSRLDELLAASDFVVVCAPQSSQNARLFRRAQFACMRRTAYFINVGRGALVDLNDLAAALDAGEIAGAALDVFETEPLPAAHPLWEYEQVILTPHVAAASPRIAERHLAVLVENVRRFAAGETPLNLVDKRAWF